MHQTLTGGGGLDCIYIRRRVDPQQLFAPGAGCLMVLQQIIEAVGDQAIPDRGEPRRTFRMIAAHVMLNTGGCPPILARYLNIAK